MPKDLEWCEHGLLVLEKRIEVLESDTSRLLTISERTTEALQGLMEIVRRDHADLVAIGDQVNEMMKESANA